jgi:hypothetical protein
LIINFDTAGSKRGALGFSKLKTKVQTCDSGENYFDLGFSGWAKIYLRGSIILSSNASIIA